LETNNRSVDIIIPVYSGTSESLACIKSVCESLAEINTRAEVVVIFDAGPDLILRDKLLTLASKNKITLLINEQNQGFVSCINKGINRSKKDVLLLNSDTVVANNWLDRIVKRAYLSTNIATVTPFSNNAEICSWPNICQSNFFYSDVPVQEIDGAFAKLRAPSVNLPTAVGFCMFIKRDCINRIGVFDVETFGRGYGEENDFCMRASAINFTHILATDVYVHHYGGLSFGDTKKASEKNAVIKLNKIYPNYNAIVARHVEEDPARKWRFAAELILQRKFNKPLVLHISHGIGGGTDKHVVELSKFCNDKLQHAMLVPQANTMRLVFPNVISGGLFEFQYNEMRELKNFLFSLSLSRLHIHHVQGWEKHIFEIIKTLDVSFDVTLHDYYFLHSNPALADKQGYFCEEKKTRDEICAKSVPLPKGISGIAWRENWLSLLNRADRIFAPSNAAAAIYNSYHSDLSITCVYHPDHEHLASYPPVQLRQVEQDEPIHVVVLGALSIIKGANVLERVSQLAAKANAPIRFTLIGFAYKKLPGTVDTLGAYNDAELPDILKKVNPHLVWFPCTWPETYSYTLSSTLNQGLPVICPQLGAFPERLQNRSFTWIEPWNVTPEHWLQRLLEIKKEFESQSQSKSWKSQPRTSFSNALEYRHSEVTPEVEFPTADSLMRYWIRELPEQSAAVRRVFRILVWFSNHKLFGHVAKLVPVWLRHIVKMKLSTKPLPD